MVTDRRPRSRNEGQICRSSRPTTAGGRNQGQIRRWLGTTTPPDHHEGQIRRSWAAEVEKVVPFGAGALLRRPYAPNATAMPRFAFAIPFLPAEAERAREAAAQISAARAGEHRSYLLDRRIYKERWWLQTGRGSPPLSLTLWDCDDITAVTAPSERGGTSHERWVAEEILVATHGVDPHTFTLPIPELLSGTTIRATAASETQTMFALPIPEEGLDAVRTLITRVEQGDLADAHQQFLADASVHEEWIWLQPPTERAPALLLVHWIGDDLDDAWQRLTFVGTDPYARVLHQALFTRLVGIPPDDVARWHIEQLSVMHVRRSDGEDRSRRRLGQRFFRSLLGGNVDSLARTLDSRVSLHANGLSVEGIAAVRDALVAVLGDPAELSATDILIGETHVLGLLERGGTPTHQVMLAAPEDLVVRIDVDPRTTEPARTPPAR